MFEKVLEETSSTFNGRVKVVRTLGLGTYIQVDGLTQSGGVVEGIWKETLKKLRHKTINKCLILGLGGGTAAKLVRKYWPEAEIVGVDIDPVMVEMGKKYLGLGEVKVEIKIGDAEDFIKSKYDLVIADLYRGFEYPAKFEKPKFLRMVKSLLSKDGVAIFNHLYSEGKRTEAIKFGKKVEETFSKIEWYYPSANLMFICKEPGSLG